MSEYSECAAEQEQRDNESGIDDCEAYYNEHPEEIILAEPRASVATVAGTDLPAKPF